MILTMADMIIYEIIYNILVIAPKIHDTVNHTDKHGMIYGTLASVQTLLTKYGMIHETLVGSSMLNSDTWLNPIGTCTFGNRKTDCPPLPKKPSEFSSST